MAENPRANMLEANVITLYVKNIEASTNFYSNILGRDGIKIAPVFTLFIQDSGMQLALMAREIVSPQSFAIGGSELAFGLAEDKDVDLMHEKWSANGITIAQPPESNAFAYSFLAMDPDGHRLRVYCFHGFKKMGNLELVRV